MYKSPKKERQDRYQKLLNLIHTFKHTKQQLKLLQKIKSDTVFQITLRHKRCQANKKYKFPFKQQEVDKQDDWIDELMSRADGKDLVYDLNSQNNDRQIGKMTSRQGGVSIRSQRQKILTQPGQREKARSLGKTSKRVLMARFQGATDAFSKSKFHETYTYRMPTQSTLASKKHSIKLLNTPRRTNGAKTSRVNSEKMKTEQSPTKKPMKLLELQTQTLKKLASRLRTERSNQKKSKMEAFVSNELKRHREQQMIKCASSALKIKPKNILHKGYY